MCSIVLILPSQVCDHEHQPQMLHLGSRQAVLSRQSCHNHQQLHLGSHQAVVSHWQ